MDNVARGLPTVLGSTAGLVVAAVGLLVQLPPQVCAMRAVAAYMVFTAFGIVIRYLLGDAPTSPARTEYADREPHIPPGTTVSELLGGDELQGS